MPEDNRYADNKETYEREKKKEIEEAKDKTGKDGRKRLVNGVTF